MNRRSFVKAIGIIVAAGEILLRRPDFKVRNEAIDPGQPIPMVSIKLMTESCCMPDGKLGLRSWLQSDAPIPAALALVIFGEAFCHADAPGQGYGFVKEGDVYVKPVVIAPGREYQIVLEEDGWKWVRKVRLADEGPFYTEHNEG